MNKNDPAVQKIIDPKAIRIRQLDGLRAVAAFGVVWIHTCATYSNPSFQIWSLDLYRVLAIAGNGVDFFFVISGFCMFLMLGNKVFSKHNYFHFLYRRLFRIAPAFYLSVLVYAVIIKIGHTDFPFCYNVFFHFCFLNNIVTGNTISGPFWSIGTEWHFYMLLPLFIYLAAKIDLLKTLFLFSGFSIILFCFVNRGYLSYDWWESQILIRFPEFGVGILVAYFYMNGKKSNFVGKYGVVAGLLIMYAGRTMKFTPVLNYLGNAGFLFKSLSDTVMTSGFGIILLNVISRKSFFAVWLSGKAINYLGRISYSIYLWHSLAILILWPLLFKLPFGNLNVIPGFFIISFLTVLISHFSYKYLEAFYFAKRKKTSGMVNIVQSIKN